MLVRMNDGASTVRVLDGIQQIDAGCWNALLAQQALPTPFMRHEYLAALHGSGSATAANGWRCQVLTLWQDACAGRGAQDLVAACALYVKDHSWGEYVFDWAWARAYQHHGVPYYPKGVVAPPFTPVTGSRLLARSPLWRMRLLHALRAWASQQGLSSLHLLFGNAADMAACAQDGWLLRHSALRFYWHNRTGGGAPGRRYRDFDDFLADLSQDKRKKIRQERRRVAQAGVRVRALYASAITHDDWDFFYRCYARTYREHGNAPYLRPAFFHTLATRMPQPWLMFVAERAGVRIASSLIAISTNENKNSDISISENISNQAPPAILNGAVAHGRYWGAVQRVDCLHFELCYYQPIAWCIAHALDGFDGGVQGEHKTARALLPQPAPSAHWVAHPGFARAIAQFVQHEAAHMQDYVQHLHAHGALRRAPGPGVQPRK